MYPLSIYRDDLYYGVLDPYLDVNFTFSKIISVINKLKLHKAPGPDFISNEFFWALPLY